MNDPIFRSYPKFPFMSSCKQLEKGVKIEWIFFPTVNLIEVLNKHLFNLNQNIHQKHLREGGSRQ